MIFRFIRALEEHTKALNRFSDVWEAGQQEQEEIDVMTATLQQANQRSKRGIDRIKSAVANQQD